MFELPETRCGLCCLTHWRPGRSKASAFQTMVRNPESHAHFRRDQLTKTQFFVIVNFICPGYKRQVFNFLSFQKTWMHLHLWSYWISSALSWAANFSAEIKSLLSFPTVSGSLRRVRSKPMSSPLASVPWKWLNALHTTRITVICLMFLQKLSLHNQNLIVIQWVQQYISKGFGTLVNKHSQILNRIKYLADKHF